MKKKLLIFHPALAPYRIDQFNLLSEIFVLKVIFVFENVWNHNFKQSDLQSQLKFDFSFLLEGPRYRGKVFRFGILKSIRSFSPDIVLGYECSLTIQYIVLLKQLGLVKEHIGTFIDDSEDICNTKRKGFSSHIRKLILKQLDYIVVLSEEVSSLYKIIYKIQEHKLIVSPILQSQERLKDNPHTLLKTANGYFHQYNLQNKIVLLFIGRFIKEKGLLNFIKIIDPILQLRDDVTLVLVGDGPEMKEIKDYIINSKLKDSIILPGRYEGQSLYAWYLCASGFTLPSFYEPFGAVVNEALIFGLPVFCSEFVGSKYLLQEEKIFIFNPHNIEETRLKLNTFLNVIIPKESIVSIPASRMTVKFNTIFNNWKLKMYD